MKIIDIEKIFSGRPPGIIGNYSYYSVLVPLVEKDGKLNLLFEKRASGLKRQPGEVCFPGGKVEEGETASECAVRETSEELGINEDGVRIISRLDSIHNYGNFTMYSFLGELGHDMLARMKFNPDEVESVFCAPLAHFIENEPFVYEMEIAPVVRDDFPYEMISFNGGYDWRRGRQTVPIYKFGDKTIWGLTARIVYNLIGILKNNAEK